MRVHTTKALQALNIAQKEGAVLVLTQEIVPRHLKLTLLNTRFYFEIYSMLSYEPCNGCID